jgi:undecaprenyl-diphosphatase
MLIASIGFSRLYLGVHFLSDVLGGYLLGILWLIIGICMTELLHGKSGAPKLSLSPLALRIGSVVLLFCGIGFYTYSGLHYHPVKQAIPEQLSAQEVVNSIPQGFVNNKLPKFTESITGETRKPLNVIFLADNDKVIVQAIQKAGWKVADPVAFSSLVKLSMTFLQGKNYPYAPVSPAFWNGQANEMSFEKAILARFIQSVMSRIWKTNLLTSEGKTSYAGLVSHHWDSDGGHPENQSRKSTTPGRSCSVTCAGATQQLAPQWNHLWNRLPDRIMQIVLSLPMQNLYHQIAIVRCLNAH